MKKTKYLITVLTLLLLLPLVTADFPTEGEIILNEDEISVLENSELANIEELQSCQEPGTLYTFDAYYGSSSSTRNLTPEHEKLVVVTKGRPAWGVANADFTTIKQDNQEISVSESIQSLDLQNHGYEVWAHIYEVETGEEVEFSTSRVSRWTQGIYNFNDKHINVDRLRYAYLGEGEEETNFLTPGNYDMAFFDVSSQHSSRTKTVRILDENNTEIENILLDQPDTGYEGVKIINFTIANAGNYTFEVTGSDSVNYFGYTCDESVEPKQEAITVEASKIVCETPDDLPRWHQGIDIDENSATEYVENNSNCTIQPNWEFQWGYGNQSNMADDDGVSKLPGSHLGEADGSAGQGTNTGSDYDEWKTFGPTNTDGVARVNITELPGETDRIWIREVLQSGYLPFTDEKSEDGGPTPEMWCHTDVLNYDNFDYIIDPEFGETYYCVAFNVEEEPTIPQEDPECQDALFNSDLNFTIEGDKVIFQNSLQTEYNFTINVNQLNQDSTTNQFNTQNISINAQGQTEIHLETPHCAYNVEVMCEDEPSTKETEEFTSQPYCDETLDCTQARHYFEYNLNGAEGTATISIPNLQFLDESYMISLASYEKQDPYPNNKENLDTQVLFDFQTENVSKGETFEFEIDVPHCAYQIDLVCGNPIYSFKDEGMYSSEGRLIAAQHPLGDEPLCTNISYPNCKDTNFINPYYEEEGFQWINSKSYVELELDEQNQICIGNDDRRQEYSFAEVDEEYCLGTKNVDHLNVSNLSFETYTDKFQAETESCYVITHYTQWEFSHVNNMSDFKTEFVFVDKTSPTINKTVKNANASWSGVNPYYNKTICENNDCFEITNQTSIQASCADEGFNPSGVNTFEYELYKDGNLSESGHANDLNITFNETGYYKLNLYCEDNVEKSSNSSQLYFFDEPTVPEDDPNITITIEQKWSLIGFPELPENTSMDSLFDHNLTKSVWTYNGTHWDFWVPGLDKHVETGVGYWVQSTEEYEISYNQTGIYQNTKAIQEGWNLVGIYKHEERNAECNFDSLKQGSDDTIFGSLYSYKNDLFTGHGFSDILSPTQGYWMHVGKEGLYTPSSC